MSNREGPFRQWAKQKAGRQILEEEIEDGEGKLQLLCKSLD